MSSNKRGLGRGFDALIPNEFFDESFDPTANQDQEVSDLRVIKVKDIFPDPEQPRREFEETALEELAASIKEHGILQPLVVAPSNTGFIIIAGERRYRAAKLAGLDSVPVLVRTPSAQHRLELSLIENLQRTDLNPIETATAYAKLRDQFNLSLEQIGERVGKKSVSTVSNTMRLLRLPTSAKQALVDGVLSQGQLKPLINLADEQIEHILPTIIRDGWSARAIEQYVVNLKSVNKAKASNSDKKPEVKTFEVQRDKLHKLISAPVAIASNSKGAGTIKIKFKSAEDLERITKLLG